MRIVRTTILLLMLSCCLPSFASPDKETKAKTTLNAADANNPTASIKSVSAHNYFTPSVYNSEGVANTFWLRYAQPIGKVLVRASLPISTVASPTENDSGLGDMTVFATYIVTRPTNKFQFGFGPTFSFPTATAQTLGTGKWQAGVALVAYYTPNPIFQVGLLATWQHSFAGRSDRRKAHAGTIQPLFFWQLKNNIYLRSTATTWMDFENGNYAIPMGVGIGKIVKAEKAVFNLFIEPQFTLWNWGMNMPKTQIFVGINTQF